MQSQPTKYFDLFQEVKETRFWTCFSERKKNLFNWFHFIHDGEYDIIRLMYDQSGSI